MATEVTMGLKGERFRVDCMDNSSNPALCHLRDRCSFTSLTQDFKLLSDTIRSDVPTPLSSLEVIELTVHSAQEYRGAFSIDLICTPTPFFVKWDSRL